MAKEANQCGELPPGNCLQDRTRNLRIPGSTGNRACTQSVARTTFASGAPLRAHTSTCPYSHTRHLRSSPEPYATFAEPCAPLGFMGNCPSPPPWDHRPSTCSGKCVSSVDQASGRPDCWEPCQLFLGEIDAWEKLALCSLLAWKGDQAEMGAPIFLQSSHPPPLLLPSSLTSQCGFFHRSSQSSSFPTDYHRARLAVQPSAMEAGGPGTVG